MENTPAGDSFWQKRHREELFDAFRKDNGDILSTPIIATTNDFIDGVNGLKDSLEPLSPSYVDDDEDEDEDLDDEEKTTIFVPADDIETLRTAYETMVRRMAKCAEEVIAITRDEKDPEKKSTERINLITGLFTTANNMLADTIASVRADVTSYKYVDGEIRDYVAKLYERKSRKKFVRATVKMFNKDFRSEIGFLLDAGDREGLD